MWQVVTVSQQTWLALSLKTETALPTSELDSLLEAVGNWQPHISGERKPRENFLRDNLHHKQRATAKLSDDALNFRRGSERMSLRQTSGISSVEIPRQVNAPDDVPLSPGVREELLRLRARVLLAAETQQLHSVLMCGAEPQLGGSSIAASLSRLLAEYERLKVAYIEVIEEQQPATGRQQMLPIGYTFQIRHTRTPNLYEIASSLGAVRIDEWLRWWNPVAALREMNEMFDLVVIHAPSITTNPDVALLAGAVDGVILEATKNVTSYASIVEADKRLRAAQANILGVTLTQEPQASPVFSTVRNRFRSLMNLIAVTI